MKWPYYILIAIALFAAETVLLFNIPIVYIPSTLLATLLFLKEFSDRKKFVAFFTSALFFQYLYGMSAQVYLWLAFYLILIFALNEDSVRTKTAHFKFGFLLLFLWYLLSYIARITVVGISRTVNFNFLTSFIISMAVFTFGLLVTRHEKGKLLFEQGY